MQVFDFDLKTDKIESLAAIFKNEDILDCGIHHFQRTVPSLSLDKIIMIASYDLAQVESLFSHGEIHYAASVEREEIKILTLTLRLNSGSIVKYVLSSGADLKTRLRFNFSVAGRVFEYDDFQAYLETNIPQQAQSTLSEKYPYDLVRERILAHLEVSHD